MLLALLEVRRFLVAPWDDPTVASRSVLMERRLRTGAAEPDPDGGDEAGAPFCLEVGLLTACNKVRDSVEASDTP